MRRWRRLNNIVHRDLGYLCFGMTLIYAISGITVNHIGDWNPTYKIERVHSMLDPATYMQLTGNKRIGAILDQLGEENKLKNSYQPDAQTLKIFVVENTIDINLPTGEVLEQKTKKRTLFYQLNFLHLNHPKKLWTWFADLYAVALAVLAITGLFILKGKKGIRGRGAILATLGFLLPILFLFLYL